MANLTKPVEKFGIFSTHLSNIITIVGGVGVLATMLTAAVTFFETRAVQIWIGLFLATFWSYIGVIFLIDRRKPRIVETQPNYDYGLTLESFNLNVDQLSDETWLRFGLQFKNYSQAPIICSIERFYVNIDTRAIPKRAGEVQRPYLPPGAAGTTHTKPFKKNDVKEFFGRRVAGLAECSVIYGHPELPPVRRLRMRFEISVYIPVDVGLNKAPITQIAFGHNIKEEIDEPYP